MSFFVCKSAITPLRTDILYHYQELLKEVSSRGIRVIKRPTLAFSNILDKIVFGELLMLYKNPHLKALNLWHAHVITFTQQNRDIC